jgi:hypothetical protein
MLRIRNFGFLDTATGKLKCSYGWLISETNFSAAILEVSATIKLFFFIPFFTSCSRIFGELATLFGSHRLELSCEDCDFTTLYAVALKRHRVTHSGELLRCSAAPDCQYETNRGDNLRNHVKSRHENVRYQIRFSLRVFFQCCGSGSALILVGWIRIRIQKDKNDPQKWKKLQEISWHFEVLDVLFWGLYLRRSSWRPKIWKMKVLVLKIWFFFICKIFNFWSSKPWIRIRSGTGSGSAPTKNAGSGSTVKPMRILNTVWIRIHSETHADSQHCLDPDPQWNPCGFSTLFFIHFILVTPHSDWSVILQSICFLHLICAERIPF